MSWRATVEASRNTGELEIAGGDFSAELPVPGTGSLNSNAQDRKW